ncbi:hypothetical protein BRD02_06905 [Halobacteriales archaeon QS_8_69_73]|nr:MAG: hypothetical protein BRD02_06905 [Halobacteriales archaeon QS_8_69_73]
MEIRDAIEADAERLAALTGAPVDVMRNLVHDRTVRVADDGDGVEGFVSYDASDHTVHVTQLEGTSEVCERLLEEPTRFADREGMDVELLVPEGDDATREAIERSDFDEHGPGPRFDGTPTTRYRWSAE